MSNNCKQINIEELKNKISQKICVEDLCNYFNVSRGTLKEICIKNNIPSPCRQRLLKPTSNHPEINKDWLITNWVNTSKSMAQLASEYHVTESLIDYRRIKYGLTKNLKNQIDLARLCDLDDPHIWYVAGLVATDGYLPIKSDAVEIDLTGNDEKKLLTEINDYYKLGTVFESINGCGNKRYRIRFSHPGIQKFFLDNFGVVARNKTFDCKYPASIPSEDCAKAYIRGCLDGDGYIKNYNLHKSVGICDSAETFIKGFINIIKEYTNIEFTLYYEYRHNKTYSYPCAQKADRQAVKQFLIWLYSIDCFRLERKYNVAMQTIASIE
jgi:DNA-binding transcriptional regulator WhiA